MNEKPLILVCNDDGIFAPGIHALIEVVKELGEVLVVAPDKPQSGKGMSITINAPIRYHKYQILDVEAYACDGTPVDCIKLAINKIVQRKPSLIVSGINHGANSSVNVIYSGTMSAAIEGALENIPAIGFSLLDHSLEANFEPSKKFVRQICEKVLQTGLPKHTCLNVNIPNVPAELIEGIKICRQANGNWVEEFDERKDPGGHTYFWLTGTFKLYDHTPDTDIYYLEKNYVTVVPIQYDMTSYPTLTFLEQWQL